MRVRAGGPRAAGEGRRRSRRCPPRRRLLLGSVSSGASRCSRRRSSRRDEAPATWRGVVPRALRAGAVAVADDRVHGAGRRGLLRRRVARVRRGAGRVTRPGALRPLAGELPREAPQQRVDLRFPLGAPSASASVSSSAFARRRRGCQLRARPACAPARRPRPLRGRGRAARRAPRRRAQAARPAPPRACGRRRSRARRCATSAQVGARAELGARPPGHSRWKACALARRRAADRPLDLGQRVGLLAARRGSRPARGSRPRSRAAGAPAAASEPEAGAGRPRRRRGTPGVSASTYACL